MDSHRSVMVVKVPNLFAISVVIQLLMVTTVTVSTWTVMHPTVQTLISSTLLEQMEAGTTIKQRLAVPFVLTMRDSSTKTLHSVAVGILRTLDGALTNVITVYGVTQKLKLPRTGSPELDDNFFTVQTVTLVLTYLMLQTKTKPKGF